METYYCKREGKPSLYYIFKGDVKVGYLLIFLARVIDMSMGTVRTIMVVQGLKVQAFFLGFVEMIFYVLALNSVVGSLDNPLNLLAYAFGFAAGNYVGITIENKIALGKISAQIILKTTENEDLVGILRENGFGVTIIQGRGINGKKEILSISLNRRNLTKLRDLVLENDETAFMTVSNISPIRGGYFTRIKK